MLRKIGSYIAYGVWHRAKALFLCFLSAVLLILSFPKFNFEFLAWFGFVPLFFLLRGKSKFKAFLISYLTGVFFWSGVIYWLVHVTLIGLVLLIFYLAIYFAIFGWIVSLANDKPQTVGFLIVPSAWVLLEYIRSFIFTGFGWALLGYSQYRNLMIIQIADIGGVWSISFLIILFNWIIYKCLSHISYIIAKRKNPPFPAVCCFLGFVILFLSLGYGLYRIKYSPIKTVRLPIKISIIQGNIPQRLKWQSSSAGFILDKYINLSAEASLDNPDLIIWPEASVPGFLYREEDAWIFRNISDLARRIEKNLLIGSVVVEGENYFNCGLLIDRQGNIIKRYNKLQLVPFGEYIPMRKLLRFLETVVPIGDFSFGKEYTIFKIKNSRTKIEDIFAVLICFEDIFPQLSRRFAKNGANFLVNITNDAWFKQTSAPYQHLSASVLRAVENRRFLIRVANTGVSGFITPQGLFTPVAEKAGSAAIFTEALKTELVYGQNIMSFYTLYGDSFVLLCLFLFTCGIIWEKRLSFKSDKKSST